jgi:hypothetical protein
VGGTLPNADAEHILILRGKDTIHVDYHKLSVEGDFSADPMLEQGDKIFVPFYDVGEVITTHFPARTHQCPLQGRAFVVGIL